MKRNIVKQGASTLMISLPAKWVKKHNLKKGEEVEVFEKDKNLIVSPGNDFMAISNMTIINFLDTDGLYIWRVLSSAYVAGYDEIRCNYDDIGILNLIKKYVVENFIGFETVEEYENFCIIKNISGNNCDEFDAVLRRIFLTLLEVSKIFMGFLNGDGEIEKISELEKSNNRQTYLLRRLIVQGKIKDEKKHNFIYSMLFLHEQLLNHYRFIVLYVKNEKESIKITKRIVEHYERLENQIEDVYKLYYRYDEKLVKKIMVEHLKTDIKSGDNLILFEDNPRFAHEIIIITELIRNLAISIVTINI